MPLYICSLTVVHNLHDLVPQFPPAHVIQDVYELKKLKVAPHVFLPSVQRFVCLHERLLLLDHIHLSLNRVRIELLHQLFEHLLPVRTQVASDVSEDLVGAQYVSLFGGDLTLSVGLITLGHVAHLNVSRFHCVLERFLQVAEFFIHLLFTLLPDFLCALLHLLQEFGVDFRLRAGFLAVCTHPDGRDC